MADRELRRMHRAELIEIIYALKQSEDQLKAQNAALTTQLQDRQLRLESAGSIAQAALELNNVFAAAQAAADDYLHSVQASLADTNATAANTLSQARSGAKRILEQAQADADSLEGADAAGMRGHNRCRSTKMYPDRGRLRGHGGPGRAGGAAALADL